jgi:hypothetical protein
MDDQLHALGSATRRHLLCFSAALTSLLLMVAVAKADSSSITEAEGYSCMGVDYSRKETENLALQDAKRKAVEFSSSYIESTTVMENFALKQDLVEAFSKADVKVIDIVNATWADTGQGDCYTIRIQAEVVPAKESLQKVSPDALLGDPSAPLTVKLWVSNESPKEGEGLKAYVRGNKPFFGRLIYKDASGAQYQVLPNPYRSDVYFQGGVIYEVPGGNDQFDLTISPPFGEEELTLYASTAPLGDLESANLGPVLEIQTAPEEVARKTRGIKIQKRPLGGAAPGQPRPGIPTVSEFAESVVSLTTSAVAN